MSVVKVVNSEIPQHHCWHISVIIIHHHDISYHIIYIYHDYMPLTQQPDDTSYSGHLKWASEPLET